MFFVLSKILGAFLKPLLWVAIILIIGIWRKRRLKRSIWIALVITFFFGNSYIANRVMTWHEYPMQDLEDYAQYDYAVVLGGFSRNRLDNGRLEFNESGDRLIAALDLLRTNKVNKIIISGGDGSLYKTGINEANEVLSYLKMVGYDSEQFIIEPTSKNTYQNAVNTAKLIPDSANVLLITSAFHMPRAAKCFKKQNIKFTPFPVDYLMDGSSQYSPNALLVPTGTAFHKWEILLKEWVGIFAYRMTGKI